MARFWLLTLLKIIFLFLTSALSFSTGYSAFSNETTGNFSHHVNVTSTGYQLPHTCSDEILFIVLPCGCSMTGSLVIVSCTGGLDDLVDLDQIEEVFTFWIKISLKTSVSLSPEIWHDKIINISNRIVRLELSGFTQLTLPLTFISSIPNLAWLKLRDGGFGSPRIPSNAFPNQNLDSLSIADCLVEDVDSTAFSYNTKLVQLDLSGNPIRHVPYNALAALNQLQIMTINHAYLATLEAQPSDTSVVLPHSLSALHLEHNQLTRIPEGFVSGLRMLSPGLRSLRLGSNHIREIPPSIFELPIIESIVLRDNLISTFPKSLKAIRNDTDVDLSGNNLSVIQQRDIPARIRRFFKPWNLRGNPLFCGNTMVWFICWLEREKPTVDQNHELLCDGTGVPMISVWNATLCRPKPQSVIMMNPQSVHVVSAGRVSVPGLHSGSRDYVQRKKTVSGFIIVCFLVFVIFR